MLKLLQIGRQLLSLLCSDLIWMYIIPKFSTNYVHVNTVTIFPQNVSGKKTTL